jgi:hypothetical protein
MEELQDLKDLKIHDVKSMRATKSQAKRCRADMAHTRQPFVHPAMKEPLLLLFLSYPRAESCVIHKSMSLKYEPSSEPLHISAKYLFLT